MIEINEIEQSIKIIEETKKVIIEKIKNTAVVEEKITFNK